MIPDRNFPVRRTRTPVGDVEPVNAWKRCLPAVRTPDDAIAARRLRRVCFVNAPAGVAFPTSDLFGRRVTAPVGVVEPATERTNTFNIARTPDDAIAPDNARCVCFNNPPAGVVLPVNVRDMRRERTPDGVIAPVRFFSVFRINAPVGVVEPVNDLCDCFVNAPAGVVEPDRTRERKRDNVPDDDAAPARDLFVCFVNAPAGVVEPVNVDNATFVAVTTPDDAIAPVNARRNCLNNDPDGVVPPVNVRATRRDNAPAGAVAPVSVRKYCRTNVNAPDGVVVPEIDRFVR